MPRIIRYSVVDQAIRVRRLLRLSYRITATRLVKTALPFVAFVSRDQCIVVRGIGVGAGGGEREDRPHALVNLPIVRPTLG